MPKLKHDRPTIGVLPGWSGLAGIIADRYLASVLRGIQSAARVKKCHLLLAWGLGRANHPSGTFPAWPVVSPDSDFVPVGPWNTDSLIVFAPLRHEARSRYLQDLSNQGFPILCIASGEKEPMISVDNEGGTRQAVTHLVNHGHSQIAFIAGDPNDRGDSESRLHAYLSVMKEHGLETDSALIVHGWHTFSGGYEAAQKMIRSGRNFTALISSDDNSAIGAMKAIREAGLRIPHDIAIIGFDDQPDAIAQVPPLATIHVPLAAIGEQALVLMFDHLMNGYNLESLQIPTHLVARQSCGCMPHIVSEAGQGGESSPSFTSHSDPGENDLESIQQRILLDMTATLPAASHFPFGERTNRLCNRLLESFYTSLTQHSSIHFQVVLMEILQELELADENIDAWQNIISILRREMTQLPAIWRQARTQHLAENLLHQARTAISESAQRQDFRHQYQWEIATQALSQLAARLSATLDEQQAVQIMDRHLTTIGIRHARVSLFEAEGDDPVAWSTLLNSFFDETSQRFDTRSFPPEGLYPSEELLNLALVPLVFQDESLGYVAFDAGNLGPCAIIARQLAATCKASRLHAQVIELSLTDALTGVYNRRHFELFLDNEVDRSRRFERHLSIMILDIDHFKEYNDSFGHQAGDRALQFVARCLQQERRSADVIARIGGEEFALILPETNAEGALKVAEKIRVAMDAPSDLKRPLTVSIGISVMHGSDIEAEMIIRQADSALYEAKGKGRDRICMFEDDGSAGKHRIS